MNLEPENVAPRVPPRPAASRTFPQDIFYRVLLCTFVVPPLVGLLFLAVYWRRPIWTALSLAAALFLFTYLGSACFRLMRKGKLQLAARLYLAGVLLVVALFLLVIPEPLIMPGVLILFVLMLLALAVEPFKQALVWAAIMALLYPATQALRAVVDVPPMDLGPWSDLFRLTLPVVELAIFIVLVHAVYQHLVRALVDSQLAAGRLQQLAAIVENSDDAIISKTPEGKVLTWNQGAERLYGYAAQEMLGRSISTLVPPERADEFAQLMERLQRGERVDHFETVRVQKGGRRIHVSITISPILDAGGRVQTISTIARDITVRKRLDAELWYLSTHDVLTGLYNRTYFQTELDRLKRGREFPVSVVLVDLDGLKRVNDEFGHAAGDDLLRRAAVVLQASFRADDAVARIGGDEFAILLPSSDATVAEESVRRVRSNANSDGGENVTPSLSLSVGTATAGTAEQLDAAIKHADERLYQDKSTRK